LNGFIRNQTIKCMFESTFWDSELILKV